MSRRENSKVIPIRPRTVSHNRMIKEYEIVRALKQVDRVASKKKQAARFISLSLKVDGDS